MFQIKHNILLLIYDKYFILRKNPLFPGFERIWEMSVESSQILSQLPLTWSYHFSHLTTRCGLLYRLPNIKLFYIIIINVDRGSTFSSLPGLKQINFLVSDDLSLNWG